MKKMIALITVLTLNTTIPLSAEALGEGSASSVKAAQSTNWQNWTVAGVALVAAAIGIIVVATNNGSASNHH